MYITVPIYNMQPTAYICSQCGTSAPLHPGGEREINIEEAEVEFDVVWSCSEDGIIIYLFL